MKEEKCLINVNWERILHKPIFKTKHKKIWILTTPPAALLRKKNCSTVDKKKKNIDINREERNRNAKRILCMFKVKTKREKKAGYTTTTPVALLRKKNCSTIEKNIPTLKEEKHPKTSSSPKFKRQKMAEGTTVYKPEERIQEDIDERILFEDNATVQEYKNEKKEYTDNDLEIEASLEDRRFLSDINGEVVEEQMNSL